MKKTHTFSQTTLQRRTANKTKAKHLALLTLAEK